MALKRLKIRTSNLARLFPTWHLRNVSEKWVWSGSRDPVNFCALSANSSKLLKLRTSNFAGVFPGIVPTWLKNVSEKRAWSRSRDPVNFWALNGNSSEMAKVTNLQLGEHAPKQVLTWTLKKFRKGNVTWPRQQYRANCSNGTDTAFHRTYSCCIYFCFFLMSQFISSWNIVKRKSEVLYLMIARYDTRKQCYRKDDRAMRLLAYMGALKIFGSPCMATPTANFPVPLPAPVLR